MGNRAKKAWGGKKALKVRIIVPALQSFSGKAAIRSQSGSWCSPVLTNTRWNSSTGCASCESTSFERERGILPAHPNTALGKGSGLVQLCLSSQSLTIPCYREEHPFSASSLLLKSRSSLPSLAPWGLRSRLCSWSELFLGCFFFNSHRWEGIQPSCMRGEVGTCLQAETFVLLNPGRLNISEAQSTASSTKTIYEFLARKKYFPLEAITGAA